jgi:TM2 domain-containing membrane protein YozV
MKIKKSFYIILILICCCFCKFANTQEIIINEDEIYQENNDVKEENETDTDEFIPYQNEEIDVIEIEDNIQTPFILTKNPTKAAFLSAFIPGAGQIYNEKYLKATGVIAIQASLIATTIYYDKKYKKFKKLRNDPNKIDEKNYNNFWYNEYYYSRQSFIFWLGGSVLMSSMEAFVDAHLINFKMKRNEIHLRFEQDKILISVEF